MRRGALFLAAAAFLLSGCAGVRAWSARQEAAQAERDARADHSLKPLVGAALPPGQDKAAYYQLNHVDPGRAACQGLQRGDAELRAYFRASGCPEAVAAMDRLPPHFAAACFAGALGGAGGAATLTYVVGGGQEGVSGKILENTGWAAVIGGLAVGALTALADLHDTKAGISTFNQWLAKGLELDQRPPPIEAH